MANINQQLRALTKKGYTLEVAAKVLNLDLDVAKMAVQSMSGGKTNLQEIVEEFKEEGLEILMEIARNGERDSDRVKAVQLLLSGEGVMPEVNAADISGKMIQFHRLLEQTNQQSQTKVIEAEVVNS